MMKAVFQRDGVVVGNLWYEDDRPFGSKNLMVEDPYEKQYVYVAESSLPGAGLGLFARVDLPKDFVASFYTGKPVDLEAMYKRSWEENAYVILTDKNVALDMGMPYCKLSNYCASLGHFANHCKDAERRNCFYADFYHPRFGDISSIKTFKEVKAGQELLVDYLFNDSWPIPEWG